MDCTRNQILLNKLLLLFAALRFANMHSETSKTIDRSKGHDLLEPGVSLHEQVPDNKNMFLHAGKLAEINLRNRIEKRISRRTKLPASISIRFRWNFVYRYVFKNCQRQPINILLIEGTVIQQN